jgi:hypothetical protein
MIENTQAVTSILVVEHGRLPTTDYFVFPQALSCDVPVTLVDSVHTKPDRSILTAGTLVVFVRYIDDAWAKAVSPLNNAGFLSGLVYFMDDDLLDKDSWTAVPHKYVRKIKRLTPGVKWLQKHKVQLWVASDFLCKKYEFLGPIVINARPGPALYERHPATKIFYHGTASHVDELHWLVPVIRQVQENCPDTTFEIFGDLTVNRLYRDIPRVSVLHPMSWDNYRAHCARSEFHIGLTPLLDNKFNAARSTTKFFDMVRCGAVGVYSNRQPFCSFIRNCEDGFLVDNDPHCWVECITLLVNNPELRRRAVDSARHRALTISSGHE